MAEVGVLNLTIHDNSSDAATGLGSLADALESVKTSLKGFSLYKASNTVSSFAKAVNANSGALKNVGTFLNAVAEYTRVFKNTNNIKFNTKPIEDLKTAIGEGIKIGQVGTQMNKLREAFSGDWGDATKVSNVIGTMHNVAVAATELSSANAASTIKSVAKSIDEYAKSINSVSGGGAHDYLQQQIFASVDSSKATGANVGYGIQQGIEETRDAVVAAADEIAKAIIDAINTRLDEHSPSEVTKQSGRYAGIGLAEGLIETKGEIQRAATEVADVLTDTVNSQFTATSVRMFDSATGAYREYNLQTKQFVDSMESAKSSVQGTSESVSGMLEYLNRPIDYSSLQEFIDKTVVLESKFRDLSAIQAFNIPALDQNGPFKYASDEVAYFSRELKRAQDDVQFFAQEYERVQKRIKYNGLTTERSNEAAQYENSFYVRIQDAEEYAKKLSEVNDYIAQYKETMRSTGSIKDYFEIPELNSLLTGLNGVTAQMATIRALSSATGIGIDEIKQQITELTNGAVQFSSAAETISGSMTEVSETASSAGTGMSVMNNATNSVEQSTSKIIPFLDNLVNKFREFAESADTARRSIVLLSTESGSLSSGLKSMFPTLTGLIKRFSSIAKMRAIRYVIRQITSGINEGLKNVYYYSQAINGDFAPAMDSAASAIAQMKNSIGAALAPVLQALIPVLRTIVNWFITMINYLNQFFALLNGQTTWTQAVEQQTQAYSDNANAANNAANAAKDLLADWDELNIIQSQNSGGGGGGANTNTPDYSSMFQQVSEFSEKIKKLVQNIEEIFGSVWNLVKRIGAAILAWKFASAFTGILATLAGLVATGLIIGLVFDVSTLFTNQYLDTGDTGWLVADVLTTFLGGVLAKKILTKVLGGSMAKIALPLTFAVSAAATIIALIKDTDTSVLSEKSILTAITAGLEGGAAVGIGIGSLAGYSTAQAFGAGVGGALFTFGVAIGLKAIATKMDAGEFTPEVIKANFLSAGAIGGGVFITELALGGTVMSALTLGGGAALLAIGALFAIEAIVDKEPAKVEFGDYKATKAEIEAFVNDKLFKEPPEVKISLIKATFEPLVENKQNLTQKAQEVIGTIEAAKVGIMTTPEEMKQQVEDFIKAYNETSQTYQNSLQVALNLVPITNNGKTDEEGTEEIIQNSSARWTELNDLMTNLGNDLADAYKVAYDARLEGNIDETAEETIREITNMMARVTAAITTGQAKARAASALEDQIMNLSKETLQGILDSYREQRDILIEEMTRAREDAAEGVLAQQYAYEELAAYALKDAGGNTADETYQYYKSKAEQAKTDYERLLETLKEDVVSAADSLGDTDSMKKVRKFMLDSIVNSLDINNMDYEIASAIGGDADLYGATMRALFKTGSTAEQKEEVQNLMDGLLASLVGQENYATYKQAIEDNVISYSDLFSKEFLDALADQMGLTGLQRKKWDSVLSGILEGPSDKITVTPADKIAEAFERTHEEVKKKIDDMKTWIDELNGKAIELSVREYFDNSPTSGSFYGKGTIDLNNRQILNNNDGTFSTENSSTIEIDGKYIVIPTVVDGKQLGIEEAIEHYKNTNEHLGMFDSLDESEIYAQLLHERQEQLYSAKQMILGYMEDLKAGNIDQSMFDTKIETLKYQFDENLINSILESLTGQNRGWANPLLANARASAGVSDVGYSKPAGIGTSATEAEGVDYTKMADSVKAGATEANTDTVSELRTIVMQLTRILNKEWVVNIQPSSSMGRNNSKSNEQLGRVTG